MSPEPKVHIIDDDPAVRDSLAFLLQSIRIPATVHEFGSAVSRRLSRPSIKAASSPISGCRISPASTCCVASGS